MSEFARPMTLAQARRQGAPLHLVADADERAAIARRFGLADVGRLEATVTVAVDGETIDVAGTLHAAVVQACIATDEPVPAEVCAALAVRYVPTEALEASEEGAEVELGDADLDVIGYGEGRVDLGEMIAESLALELDPYPRSAGAETFLKQKGIKSEAEAGSFGALAGLRDALSKPD